MFSADNELIVPASKTKLLGVVAGACAFVVLSVWLLSRPYPNPIQRTRAQLVAVGAIVFFGACGVYGVTRLLRPTPAVIINDKGIVDNASALSTGFIAWEEIAELREYRFQNQTFLGIYPKRLDALLARQSAWKRHAINANMALGVAPVNIPQVVLPMSAAELMSEINARFGDRIG